MVMTVLMVVGTVGALLPMLRRGGPAGRVRWAHGCMVTVMAAMVVFGMDAWIAVPSTIALVVAALFVTGEDQDRSVVVPCAVDLTAMAVLLLLIPASHSHTGPTTTHHGGAPSDPRIFALLVHAAWATLTLYNFRKNPRATRATVGTALMVVGMAPVAF